MSAFKTKDVLVVGGSTALIGLGLYLSLKKPAAIYLGDTFSFAKVEFFYRGPETTLWICWGLRDGWGDFNNGGNLVAGLWVSGGPMMVEDVGEFKKYSFVPADDFDKQPAFFFDPNFIEPKNYEPYIWLSTEEGPNEDYFLLLIRGPQIDIKG